MQFTAMVINFIYDSQLFRKWKAERPHKDKMNSTFASYNAGFRTILNAQDVCEKQGYNENLWYNIEKIAPMVKGWRHEETIGYLDKINHLME